MFDFDWKERRRRWNSILVLNILGLRFDNLITRVE